MDAYSIGEIVANSPPISFALGGVCFIFWRQSKMDRYPVGGLLATPSLQAIYIVQALSIACSLAIWGAASFDIAVSWELRVLAAATFFLFVACFGVVVLRVPKLKRDVFIFYLRRESSYHITIHVDVDKRGSKQSDVPIKRFWVELGSVIDHVISKSPPGTTLTLASPWLTSTSDNLQSNLSARLRNLLCSKFPSGVIRPISIVLSPIQTMLLYKISNAGKQWKARFLLPNGRRPSRLQCEGYSVSF